MSKLAKGTLFGRVHDFLKLYLPKQRRLSANTIRAYQKSLELLFDFVKNHNDVNLSEVTFEMLTADTVAAFLENLEAERGCSISTRNHRLAAVKAFIAYAAAMDITAVAVQTEIKKVPNKKTDAVIAVEYMSEAAISAVLDQPDSTTEKGLRDRCLMILMYDTGARVQEIADIKLGDFRYGKTPTVTLNGKGGKMRTVPIMVKTVLHLRQYISIYHEDKFDKPDSPLFYSVIHGTTKPISDRRIRDIVKEYGFRAREKCLEVPENVHPHLFRHSRAMHLYQHGMDLTLVSQWLGHSHLEATLIYAHADTEHKRKAIASATKPGDPMYGKLNPERFTVSDEETLKRLYGLK